MKEHILKELNDEFPENPSSIDIGYYDGRQSSKIWLVSNDQDLCQMYRSSKQREVSLWIECTTSEGESEDEESYSTKKRKKQASKRQGVEDEVDSIYSKLESKHSDSGIYSIPQLRLWARMIQCGTYDNYDDPPRVPLITGLQPRRSKESLTEAITGAAVAVAKAFTPKPSIPAESTLSTPRMLSPVKSAELRMKNLQQLQFIKQLMEDNI